MFSSGGIAKSLLRKRQAFGVFNLYYCVWDSAVSLKKLIYRQLEGLISCYLLSLLPLKLLNGVPINI